VKVSPFGEVFRGVVERMDVGICFEVRGSGEKANESIVGFSASVLGQVHHVIFFPIQNKN
jgi:hypothetical protein